LKRDVGFEVLLRLLAGGCSDRVKVVALKQSFARMADN
jgi:hypothetical protein